MIGDDDLSAFSEELQEGVRASVRLSDPLTLGETFSEREAKRGGLQ